MPDIESNLPTAPAGYHYEVEFVSKLVSKVWLVHEHPYDYACGKPVKTIYAFVKGTRKPKVHQPKDSKTCYVKSRCDLVDLPSQSPYTLFVPSKLFHFD